MSRSLSSLSYDETEQKLASIVEVNFTPELALIVKAKTNKNSYNLKLNTTNENVVEVKGRIIVSF